MDTTSLAPLLEHRDKLLAFVRKKIGDPELAEDLLQDALLKALRAADDIRDDQKLLPWFYRILQNAIIDLYRRRAARPSNIADPEPVLERLAAVEPEDTADLCACFSDLLPSLKPEYRALIERLDLAGEPSETLAAELGITRTNLKVRHHRARQALKGRLEESCRVCATHGCLDCTCQRT